jgi:hypothetical protein
MRIQKKKLQSSNTEQKTYPILNDSQSSAFLSHQMMKARNVCLRDL